MLPVIVVDVLMWYFRLVLCDLVFSELKATPSAVSMIVEEAGSNEND